MPKYDYLRVFGCLCFASTLKRNRTKLDERARRCIFIGYPAGMKGYTIYDLETEEIFVSRNVVFHEDVFPFASDYISRLNALPPERGLPEINNPNESIKEFLPTIDKPETTKTSPAQPEIPSQAMDSEQTEEQSATTKSHDNQELTPETITEDVIDLRPRSQRIRQVPKYLSIYQHDISDPQANHSMTYPIQRYLSSIRLSPSYAAFTSVLSTTMEPQSYEEATQHAEWISAMEAELAALDANQTWKVVSVRKSIHTIGCKWIFKVKMNADGTIERHKARLVAKGYSQIKHFDYKETFNPVIKHTTVRLFFALAASQSWFLRQLDVNNAFLNGELTETIFMDLPPGYPSTVPHSSQEKQACQLTKALYGLKQASRHWNTKFSEILFRYGFQKSSADHSLFTYTNGDLFIALLVYVDDIMLGSTSETALEHLVGYLKGEFKLKDLGVPHYFLGLEIARSKKGIILCQRKYTLDLLHEYGLLGAKPFRTPLQSNDHLHHSDSEKIDPTIYRKLVGKLIYLTFTRPDLCYTVQVLSQYMSQPTIEHFKAALRVLRYLKGSPGCGVFYSSTSPRTLKVYSDSDWAKCQDTRRSVSGYCVFLGNSIISGKAKKQNSVAKSSTEAEYRAMSTATCEVLWILNLLRSFHIPHNAHVPLLCDNKSAIQIAVNPIQHERTKHFDIDWHFVREQVERQKIQVLYVSSQCQLADILTKGLDANQHEWIMVKMSMINIHSPLEGA
ncbi:hypothetical protein ZIOFF_016854 [Zingiber officinale]|uniref:Reverse transcriptase Ty1/copia-type domain-containing protein n=1 Tax=Zingiber officinale TaxID=94328 RepID=A0A8J5HEX2_ZINOF|nr:hypothetical protein ZIOFF_016854 [Zingiber officinale]